MSAKPHEIIWHKKKAKFFSSSLMRPHHEQAAAEDAGTPSSAGNPADRRQRFMRSLKDKIKNAVKNA